MKTVVIEQSQIISPFGKLSETVDNLMHGAGAIVPGPCFDVPVAYAPFADTKLRDLRYCVSQLKSDIIFSRIDPTKTVFIFTAAKGDIRALEEQVFSEEIHTDISPMLDDQAQLICELLEFMPARRIVVSNACASGSNGIEVAIDLLRTEKYTHAMIFGFDCISRFTTTGFHSLSALSETGARPFDAARDGLSLGDGVAVAVLSFRKPDKGDICIIGGGSSNDANHRTGPSRTGEGLYRAAKEAIADAGISPEQVGAVKCHGTATSFNDAMEAKALHLLFGEEYPPCVSFKGAIGHLSGVSSLVELIITAECLKTITLPPTRGFEKLGVDEPVKISANTQEIKKPTALCLSAGFGGLNSAIVIREQK